MDDPDIELYKIHRARETETQDVNVEHIWIDDFPGMGIRFDVALSVVFEVHEADYLYDEAKEKNNTIIHECVHWDKHQKAFGVSFFECVKKT